MLKAVANIGGSGGGGGGGGNLTISAGTNSSSSGLVNLSNANGVSFGMDPSGNVTASFAAGAANIGISAGTNSTNASTVNFSNSNGVSFGMNTNAVITASYTVPTQTNQTLGLYGLGNTTQNSSTTLDARSLSFDGLGIVTVGYSNGSIQLSATTVAQTNQTAGFYAVGNTTQNSSTTLDARTVSFNGLGIVTVGFSNGSIDISATTAAQTNQSIGWYAVGNTTQNSSTTLDARTLSIDGLGGITAGFSNGSIQISGPQTVAQTNQTLGIYAVSNTTLSTSGTVDARTLSFEGAGAVSVGVSNGSVQISAPNTIAQTNQTAGFYAVGNTTQNSSTTLDARSLSFNGLGGVTIGYSNGSIDISGATPASGVALYDGANSITSGTARFTNANGVSFTFNGQTISGSVAAQTNQTAGFYAVGNTTQNSSTTLDARTLSFNGLGIVTVGYSNGSIDISASQTAQTAGFYAVGNTTQNSSTTLDARTISYNFLGAATGGFSNGSIDISVPVQTNQTLGFYAVGNTTQNSSTTLDARTLSFDGLGAQTVGYSNGSIQLSVPATSSLVGTNGISISTNGSTISVSYLGNTAGSMLSYYEPSMRGGTSTNTMANGTLYVQPFVVSTCVSAYQLMQYQQVSTQPTTTMSFSASASSQTSSAGTGSWAQSGTVLLFSRQSTGTAAASSNLISCGSNSYSFGVGHSASVSWSTNVLSFTASVTTSGAASFISNINSTGGSSSGSFGTSGTTSWSSQVALSGSFSQSFIMTLASQMFSGVRPIFCPLGTSLTPGEYWLGNIISTGSGSTNMPLQQVCIIPGGNVGYTSNTSAYAEIGSTATIAGSNIPVGWGSYSSSGNTSTTFPMSNISNMSNNQTWFALAAWTK